jgi:hypothetical protein
MVGDSCVPSRRARGSEFPPVRKIVTSRLLALGRRSFITLVRKSREPPRLRSFVRERPLQTTYDDNTHESTQTDVEFKSE